jgi:hypothetical protein
LQKRPWPLVVAVNAFPVRVLPEFRLFACPLQIRLGGLGSSENGSSGYQIDAFVKSMPFCAVIRLREVNGAQTSLSQLNQLFGYELGLSFPYVVFYYQVFEHRVKSTYLGPADRTTQLHDFRPPYCLPSLNPLGWV